MKYRVRVERDQLQYGYVEVDAKSVMHAMGVAETLALHVPIEWESAGKGGATEPRVVDTDCVEEIP